MAASNSVAATTLSVDPANIDSLLSPPSKGFADHIPDRLAWLRGNASVSLSEFADRHRYLLFTILTFFYAAAFNGQWRIQSDAALYLSIGRNLAHGLGFTYLGQTNRVAYPGWPGLIALTFKLFGGRSLVPVNALMTLMALATVGVTYRLFFIHTGRPTAVVIALGVGLTKAFFTYAFELWSDMPFALGIICALAGFEGLSVNHDTRCVKKRSKAQLSVDAIFLFGGLLFAGSMRPTIWPFLVALVVALAFRALRRRTVGWIATSAIAFLLVSIVAAYLLARVHSDSPGFGGVYEEYLVDRLAGKTGTGTHLIADNFNNLFSWAASDVLFQARLGSVCNALLSTLVLALGFGLLRHRMIWGLWFALLLGTILIAQETLDRYFLPVLPLLVFAWWDFLVRISRKFSTPWGNVLFFTLLTCGAVMNVTKVFGIITQQQTRPFLASYDKGQFDGAPEFAKVLNRSIGEKAVVLAIKPYGRVTAYLSERFVTGPAGTSPDLLKSRRVFVMEPTDIYVQDLLKTAGLCEGPALFTVNPSPGHGPKARPLSLHSTLPYKP